MTVSPTPIPSVTGNPGLDSLIRSGLIAASTAVTGGVVAWLYAHGFKDPNTNMMVAGVVFTGLSALVTAVWGYLKGTQIGKEIVNAQVTGVNAGMNLAASGQMLMTGTGDGNDAPVPATAASAPEIIKQFAPPKPTSS